MKFVYVILAIGKLAFLGACADAGAGDSDPSQEQGNNGPEESNPSTTLTVSIEPNSPVTTDTLTAQVQGLADTYGDDVSLSYVWKVNGTNTGVESTLAPSEHERGDEVVLEVTVDGVDDSTVVSPKTITQNSTPTVNSVLISPSSPGPMDTLSATASASDDDGDFVLLSYVWRVNNVNAGNGSTLASSEHEEGDEVFVEATANDGTDESSAASPTITIQN